MKTFLYFLSRVLTYITDLRLAAISLILLAVAMAGCAQLPSVQACRHAKYERNGDVWEVELKDCRVMSAPLPSGL